MTIIAKNLGKSFRLEDRALDVLKGINVTIGNGRFASLLGPSGCGKSTFLRCVAGLDIPTQGELLIDDTRVSGPGPDRAMVFQDYALLPWYTVRENVELGLKLKRNKAIVRPGHEAEIANIIRLVGLSGFEEAYPHQISGGMKQRAAIARALAVEPRALLMDEPFAAIDAITRESMQRQLVEIWSATKKTILFVTHSVEEAVLLSSEVHVFGSRPASIRHTQEIDLPHPREPKSRRFVEIVAQLKNEINSSHVNAEAMREVLK